VTITAFLRTRATNTALHIFLVRSGPGHIAKMPRNLVSSFIILPLSFRKGWGVIVGGLTLSTITSHEHASSPVQDHGGCPRAFSFDHSSCITRKRPAAFSNPIPFL